MVLLGADADLDFHISHEIPKKRKPTHVNGQ